MSVTERPPRPRFSDWLYDRVFRSFIWQSVFRSGYPNNPRNQMLVVATNVFLHLHPTRLHKTHVKITHTYCLGGLSFFLFLSLTVTGVLLMFYYVPSVERAYQDIAALETNVRFGLLMRNLHRWTAHAMVITVFLHMMRVFYTGAYKPPREFNWAVGVILLVLTLLLSFTGYLLPWDQLAVWAITVGTNMIGSAPVLGEQTRFVLIGGFEVEAILAVGRSPRRGFAAPRDMGFEDGAGAEGLRSGEAGFEGMKLDEGIGGGGANGEHQVYGGGDGGGAAEDTVAVGVVDDEDGGLAGLGQAAQIEEHRLDGGLAAFSRTQEVGKGIDDDEAGAAREGAVDEGIRILSIAQVVAAQGDVVERGGLVSSVGVEGGVEAAPELVEAGFFVDEEHWAGVNRVT